MLENFLQNELIHATVLNWVVLEAMKYITVTYCKAQNGNAWDHVRSRGSKVCQPLYREVEHSTFVYLYIDHHDHHQPIIFHNHSY